MKPLTEPISAAYLHSENILFNFHIGRAVRIRSYCKIQAQWGHVTGFTLNPCGETVLLIKTELQTEMAIHPANVEICR